MAPLRSVPEVRWALRCGLAVSGWLAWAAVDSLPDGAAVRVLVTTVFLLLCPGLAAARWARPTGSRRAVALATAVLAVAISVSLSVLVVVAFYLSGAFTTTRVLIALAVVTTGLALFPRPGEPHARAPRAAPDDAPPTWKRR
jgi:FtsH-binding integral membrane protein